MGAARALGGARGAALGDAVGAAATPLALAPRRMLAPPRPVAVPAPALPTTPSELLRLMHPQDGAIAGGGVSPSPGLLGYDLPLLAATLTPLADRAAPLNGGGGGGGGGGHPHDAAARRRHAGSVSGSLQLAGGAPGGVGGALLEQPHHHLHCQQLQQAGAAAAAAQPLLAERARASVSGPGMLPPQAPAQPLLSGADTVTTLYGPLGSAAARKAQAASSGGTLLLPQAVAAGPGAAARPASISVVGDAGLERLPSLGAAGAKPYRGAQHLPLPTFPHAPLLYMPRPPLGTSAWPGPVAGAASQHHSMGHDVRPAGALRALPSAPAAVSAGGAVGGPQAGGVEGAARLGKASSYPAGWYPVAPPPGLGSGLSSQSQQLQPVVMGGGDNG